MAAWVDDQKCKVHMSEDSDAAVQGFCTQTLLHFGLSAITFHRSWSHYLGVLVLSRLRVVVQRTTRSFAKSCHKGH